MSKDYTFDGTLAAVVGNPTKASDYNDLVENTKEINQRLEGIMLVGTLLPQAGTEAIAYDGSGRVSTITYATSPVGVVTVVYDDGNGGRVDYVEGVFTDPVAATIRMTYGYDGSGNVTGVTRTVS
jgi:hypothetical protein